jgi:hypothetical protein
MGVYFTFKSFGAFAGMGYLKSIKSQWHQNSKGVF